MKVYQILKTAMRGLRRNVMRAALTTLGIIIGVAAVIAMMEIGNGSSIAIQQHHRQHGRQQSDGPARGPRPAAASVLGPAA